MTNAVYDTVSVDIEALPKEHKDKTIKNMLMRLSGSNIKFKGFLVAYEEKSDDFSTEKEAEMILPPIKVGETLPHDKTEALQSFTKPPGRLLKHLL